MPQQRRMHRKTRNAMDRLWLPRASWWSNAPRFVCIIVKLSWDERVLSLRISRVRRKACWSLTAALYFR